MIRNAWRGIKHGFSVACCDISTFFFLHNADSFSVMLEFWFFLSFGFLFANIFPFLTLSIYIRFLCYFLHAAIQDFLTWFIKATMNPLSTFKLLYQWLPDFLHLNSNCLPSKPPSLPSVSVQMPAFYGYNCPNVLQIACKCLS